MNPGAMIHLAEGLECKILDSLWSFAVVQDYTAEAKYTPDGPRTITERLGTLDPNCGAVGCAVGWAPVFFPGIVPDIRDVCKVLDIPLLDACVLFGFRGHRLLEDDEPVPWIYPGSPEDDRDVTRRDVATKIREYVENGGPTW